MARRRNHQQNNQNQQRRETPEQKQKRLAREQTKEIDYITKKAVNKGIHYLVKEHPQFASFEGFLNKYIDQYALQEAANSLAKEVYNNDSISDKKQVLYERLASYVASGEMLDEKGKEKILQRELQEGPQRSKGLLFRIFHKQTFPRDKSLYKTFEAFDDLTAMMQSGDYARKMPELSAALKDLDKLKFLNPAIEVLKDGGLINDKVYKRLKDQVYDKAKEGSLKVPRTIESYLVSEKEDKIRPLYTTKDLGKLAASILSFFGFGLILGTSPGITGNAIKVPELFSSTGSIIGAIIFILGLILFFLFNTSEKKAKTIEKQKVNRLRKSKNKKSK